MKHWAIIQLEDGREIRCCKNGHKSCPEATGHAGKLIHRKLGGWDKCKLIRYESE